LDYACVDAKLLAHFWAETLGCARPLDLRGRAGGPSRKEPHPPGSRGVHSGGSRRRGGGP